MNKTKQLETALECALKEGILVQPYKGDFYIRTAGCSCCSFGVYPTPDTPQDMIPEEIKAVVLKAAKKVASWSINLM